MWQLCLRKLHIPLTLMVAQLFVALPAWSGSQETIEAKTGRVFIMAEEIPAPWAFSGIGEDTLRLNGVPFMPVRWNAPPPPVVTEEYRQMHRLHMKAREAEKKESTSEARLLAMEQVYQHSPLVQSVKREGPAGSEYLVVFFHRGSAERVHPSDPTEGVGKIDMRKVHENLIAEFHHAMSLGYLWIAPMSSTGGGYMCCPPALQKRTVAVLALIRSDQPVSEETVRGSCLSPYDVADLRKIIK